MKSAKQYTEMSQMAAYKIVQAMSVFDNEPAHIRQQAEQIIMQRVQQMRGGNNMIIEGDGFIKEVIETPEPTPEPEPTPDPVSEDIATENPETDPPQP